MKYSIYIIILLSLVCSRVNSFLKAKGQGIWLNHVRYSTQSAELSVEDESFKSIKGIPRWVLNNCARLNYTKPTVVQQMAIPKIFDGKDVIIQSPTGSGKTLTYALPILSKLDLKRRAIQAVVIVPTRELCLQVTSVFHELAANALRKVQIMAIMEGSKNIRYAAWAAASPPQIVVGNIRSLQTLVDRGQLKLGSVSFIVLDEVDAMFAKYETKKELHELLSRHLSNSFNSEAMEELHQEELIRPMSGYRVLGDTSLPEVYRASRRCIFCSATIPQRQHFAEICKQNGWTETIPELILMNETVPAQIGHYYLECDNDINTRIKMLSKVIAQEIRHYGRHPDNNHVDHNIFQAIVFCGSDDNMELVYEEVSNRISSMKSRNVLGSDVVSQVRCLTESGMTTHERSRTLEAFRSGNVSIMVCAVDVAARGLDIPSTSHIFQLNLPLTADEYLHQSGRTGRFGRAGTAITLVHPNEKRFVLQKYENLLHINFEEYELEKIHRQRNADE